MALGERQDERQEGEQNKKENKAREGDRKREGAGRARRG